jgi:hypothetical protein
LVPEAYAAFAMPILAAFATVTSQSDVADAVYRSGARATKFHHIKIFQRTARRQ